MISARTISAGLAALLCAMPGVARLSAEGSAATVSNMSHASLAKYPGAVISLKDPHSGMVFYVETNGRIVVALTAEGRIAWTVEVPPPGGNEPECIIRNLRVDGDTLWVTCGKSDAYTVAIDSGEIRFEGSD